MFDVAQSLTIKETARHSRARPAGILRFGAVISNRPFELFF
jgi:hypothetical protein